jgi:hypothetical protein
VEKRAEGEGEQLMQRGQQLLQLQHGQQRLMQPGQGLVGAHPIRRTACEECDGIRGLGGIRG